MLQNGRYHLFMLYFPKFVTIQLIKNDIFSQAITHIIIVLSMSVVASSRLMPNIGGSSNSRRYLLSVVHRKLLFVASVWTAPVAKTTKNRSIIATDLENCYHPDRDEVIQGRV